MSKNTSIFSILPWKIPKSLPNFVPECSRCFSVNKYSVFFAWRHDISLIFTFNDSTKLLSSKEPLQSQVIMSKEPILDIVLIGNCTYFVSSGGLFQVLSSKETTHFGEVMKNLGHCKTFSLSDAFELSPLKRILAVTSMPNSERASFQNFFVVIMCTKDDCKVDAELYSVVVKETSPKAEYLPRLICSICSSNSSLNVASSTCSFLSCNQTIFSDWKEAEILLIGLDTGQLFCVPYFLSARSYGLKPIARLIYQSQWPISGLTCPTDGSSIFLFLQGGTVVNISPLSNKISKSNHTRLSYSSFTLPYPMRCFAVPSYDSLFISDTQNTSVIHVVSQDHADTVTIHLKGITAMSSVPEANLVIASSFHNDFYLLDPSNTIQNEDSSNPTWAGCNIDVSLQLVQDMRAQTKLLSKLRKELEEEDSLIKALSAVARASLMSEYFKITVQVKRTCEEQATKYVEDKTDFSTTPENIQEKHKISIEIKNNSSEDFPSSLWKMCLEIKSSDGLAITKHVPLERTFNQEFPFCTSLYVPFLVKKFSLPIQVKADLVAEIKDGDGKSQWLKICLGMVSLDISHFFSVSVQSPQASPRDLCDISVLLNQMQSHCAEADPQREELREKALMTSYIIPIPEKFRQPKMIIDQIFSNCQQRHSLTMDKDFYNQSEKTVIWLKFLQKSVKLVFRKSCASISISSTELDVLHAVKLYLASVFGGNLELSLTQAARDASSDVVYSKARNLSAVLETLSLNEDLDISQLISIYQELRNNVSSHIL